MHPHIYCDGSVVSFVELQMGLEMYTVMVQCFGGEVTSPPCLQAVFVMDSFSWEGSSLMQGNLSCCNMRLAFQLHSLWSWQLLVLYAASLAPAASSFRAFFHCGIIDTPSFFPVNLFHSKCRALFPFWQFDKQASEEKHFATIGLLTVHIYWLQHILLVLLWNSTLLLIKPK